MRNLLFFMLMCDFMVLKWNFKMKSSRFRSWLVSLHIGEVLECALNVPFNSLCLGL